MTRMRANTDTGNCVVRRMFTSLAVDMRPGGPMPSTASQWSAAKSASCGERKRGFSVFWIRPRRTASGSSSPSAPVASARRFSLSRSACSSVGLVVGAISERLTDMGPRVVRAAAAGHPFHRAIVGPARRRAQTLARRSAQEQTVHRVVRLVLAGIGQRGQEFTERLLVFLGHLDADQDAAVVGALVAIVEQ